MLGGHSTWSDVIEVLEPFEVGDGYTTDVGKHVWDDHDASLFKDLIGHVGCWTVGTLDDDLALELLGVVGVD